VTAWGQRFSGGRAGILAALVAATLAGAPAAAVALAARAAGAATGASNGGPPAAPAPSQAGSSGLPLARSPVGVRYRPVGCARRGPAVAYRDGRPSRKVVALSFDDGPWPDTPAFVRMLEAQRVPATFFMIGEQVTARYRATLRRELRDGDALGDHTYTHPDLVSAGGVYGQLDRTIVAIRRLTGYAPCVFRPPYGDYDQSVVNAARSLGLATILWGVDPSDWALPGVGAIEQRVLAQVRPGSIILSHDGGGSRAETLTAYPYIIRALRARGYRFETVPRLLGFHTLYRRCVSDCEGEGTPGPLPPESIVLK
jgi:peptidoglycan-N-acetylglucosamine deacetylase